jgi:hypothetical protein
MAEEKKIVKQPEMPHDELKGKNVMLKSNCQGIWVGVFGGYRCIAEGGKKLSRHILTLTKARRIWELGNHTFDELAETGPNKKSTCQVLAEVEKAELEDKILGNPALYRLIEIEDKVAAAFAKREVYEHQG